MSIGEPGFDGGPGNPPQERQMDKENEKNEQDWASQLINHLLTIVSVSAEKVPEGFTLDGVSMQRYAKGQFNITFSFKS